jgi:glutamate transport system permease protein
MEQLWSLMPEFWEGFKVTLLLLVVSGCPRSSSER